MPLLLLIRHGENDYAKTGKMAGRLPGVHRNQRGQDQARALGDALKDVPILREKQIVETKYKIK